MFESNTANLLTAWLPELSYTLPLLGTHDYRPVVAAGLMFIALTILFWLLRAVVLGRVRALAKRTRGNFDDTLVDAVSSVRPWVYTLVALYISLQFFAFPGWLTNTIDVIFYGAVVWQVIAIASCFITYFVQKFLEKDEDGDGVVDPNAATISDLVRLVSKIVLWVFGVIFILSNLGIEVTSLIAGLGIGGIAIAFALQGILSDLFASFSIYSDRPFRVGDFIVIGADSGTVEKIGIKSTRIRTLQGEELVVSNAELTTTRVQNFKKMDERREVAQFGITYETPQEKVREVNGVVERIFADIEAARLDRTHFSSFGDSALIFEVVYYVESSDYTEFMNIQQQFNFTLMQRFAELGIEFAYPTQTVYHKAIKV